MPILTAPIPDISVQVIDPIIRQTIDRVVATLGLTDIFEDNLILKTKYSGVSRTSDSLDNAKLSVTRLEADINIQQNPLNVKWPTTTFHHSPAHGVGPNVHRRYTIFNDKELGFGLFEQGAPCSIAMQCNMLFYDRSLGYDAATRLFNIFQSGNIHQVMDFQYTYKLPYEVEKVLGTLYQMKRFTKKFSTFFEYLRYWSGNTVSMDRSRYGDRPIITVKKQTNHCLMSVEYSDDEPSPEKVAQATDTFSVPFTLYIQFQLINTLYLSYPVIVENRLVPIDAIPLDYTSRYHTTLGSMEDRHMEGYRTCHVPKQRHMQIPFYDDWSVPNTSRSYKWAQSPVLIAACTIDEDKDVNTIDLNGEMGDSYFLTDVVKDILIEQERIRPRGSLEPDAIFNLSVYYGDFLLTQPTHASAVQFDPDKMEITYKGRRLQEMYHFVLSEIADFKKLNKIYYPILYKFRYFLDIAVVQQLKFLINYDKLVSFEYDPSKFPGYFIQGDIIYDEHGNRMGELQPDGSWIDLNGKRHDIGYISNQVGDHGNRLITRILTCDIVAARKTSRGEVVTREQYQARRVR